MLYRELVNRLKLAYPQYDVSIRRVKISKKLSGDCDKRGNGWRIRICNKLNDSESADTLIHEFAHVPSWDEWVATGSHGPQWAKHYARCYKIYEEIAESTHG
jgi:hypothetical protein